MSTSAYKLIKPTTAVWAAGAAGAAAMGAFSYAAFWPRSQWFLPVHFRGPIDDQPPRIALTFDDGPHPRATPAVLDILRAHAVPATFFVIGEHARQHPRLIERIDREGHLPANHSFSHDWSGLFFREAYWREQLHQTDRAIHQAIGKSPRLFRPPMGFKHHFLARAVRRDDYELVTWTRRGRDGWPTDVNAILDRLAKPTQPGDILTLHDGHDRHLERDFQPTIDALGPLIETLHQRGFTFSRLDDLLSLQPYR